MRPTYLVTGATGFLGGHLARRLSRQADCDVRVLVRPESNTESLRDCGLEFVVGDLLDRESLRAAVSGVAKVYHIAASFRAEPLPRDETWRTNVQGTRDLLEASLGAKVERFIYCSSVGVHGSVKDPPGTEDSPFDPGDIYQRTKAEAEQVVSEFTSRHPLPVVIFRPAGIYGPGDLRFLKLFKTIKAGTFRMIGSGEVLYQMIYVDDLVDGILLCGTSERATGEAFILAEDQPYSLNYLAQSIAEILGVELSRLKIPATPVYLAGALCELVCKTLKIRPPIFRRRVDFFRKTRAFSIEKAQRVLGFSPKVGLREGLQRTADWYQTEGLL